MKKALSFLLVAAIFICCISLTGCCCCINSDSPAPPAGAYGVSSVGTMDGSVIFHDSPAGDVMMIENDGTGTFFFKGQEYDIAFEDGKLQVDGRSLSYQYMTSSPDEPMLVIYWTQDNINTVILRRLADNIFYSF